MTTVTAKILLMWRTTPKGNYIARTPVGRYKIEKVFAGWVVKLNTRTVCLMPDDPNASKAEHVNALKEGAAEDYENRLRQL